jgi:3'-phosphoadenosine 5'-phosphosulfate sulfotransferase (PAPS reductase)/FAD synthetase
MELWQLRQRQSNPLEVKEVISELRIRQWYEANEGNVYVSFSGGKDSTVLLDLVWSIYPHVPAVFIDTGLEYPEIRDFVKTFGDKVKWLKPKMHFKEVIKKYGYPVISKEQSFRIRKLRNQNLTEKYRTAQLEKLGKWKTLLAAPFECSEQCCNAIKKKAFKEYEKKTGNKPIIGMMAAESSYREQQYLETGCNAFNLGRPQSQPIAFWTEKDIWDYLNTYKIPYSKIYDMGETRTGCMFCMFGVHLEKEPNRFQRMATTHPQLYDYCFKELEEGGLGLGHVLDYINVPYRIYEGKFLSEYRKVNGKYQEQLKMII